MMKCLNLGSGESYKEGWDNLDIKRPCDIIHDLNKFPYPLKSNYYDLVLADNIIEHLYDTVKFMKEIHKILKPDRIVIIRIPYYNHPVAWIEPTHKKALSEDSFRYFCYKFYIKNNPVEEMYKFSEFGYKYKYVMGIPNNFITDGLAYLLRHIFPLYVVGVEVRLRK